MAAFCGQCGTPLNGQAGFCANCGARASQAPAPSALPPAAAGSGSGLKIVLIIVGVLFVLGALGATSVYFAGRRMVREAAAARGYDMRPASSSSSGGLLGSLRRAVHHDGCALLPPDEVASILGIEVGKADGQPSASEKGEHCDYFLKPGTSDAYAEKLKESVTAAQAKAGTQAGDPATLQAMNDQARKGGAENVLKNLIRAAGAVANDGSQPFFSFAVEREGGRDMFGVLERSNSADRVLFNGNEVIEKLSGVGDRAFLTPLDSSLIVLKGDACLTLNLTQVPDGKEKGKELAKRVLARL